MVDGLRFAENMRRRAREVEENSTRGVRRIALAAFRMVVRTTPYDTGRAISNWRLSVGFAYRPVREPFSYKGGASANWSAALAEAQVTAQQFTVRKGSAIFLTNSVPYILRLNEGWSKQAPAGFIQRGIAAGVAEASKVRLLSGN